MAMVQCKLASRQRKLCLCDKNTGNRTLKPICATVARMDMRIWKYSVFTKSVGCVCKCGIFFRDSFHSEDQSLGSTQGLGNSM